MNNQLNSVLIEGNLVKDPALREFESGKSVCNFTIASNRYFRKDSETKKEVSYFDVEVWDTLSENCHKYLSKGRGVRVSGRLRQDRWEDEEGKTQARVKIVGEHVEFQRGGSKKQEEVEAVEEKTPEASKAA